MGNYEKDKERRKRKEMEQGGSRFYLTNEKVKAGIRERFRELVLSYINKGQEVPFADIRYRAVDWRYDGDRVNLTVVHQLIEEMQDEGLVLKELVGNTFYLKPTRRGGLDELYAPVLKSSVQPVYVQADKIMGHTRGGFGAKVSGGYRSYWEAVDWPASGAW